MIRWCVRRAVRIDDDIGRVLAVLVCVPLSVLDYAWRNGWELLLYGATWRCLGEVWVAAALGAFVGLPIEEEQ